MLGFKNSGYRIVFGTFQIRQTDKKGRLIKKADKMKTARSHYQFQGPMF
jgi:hypothetical protein